MENFIVKKSIFFFLNIWRLISRWPNLDQGSGSAALYSLYSLVLTTMYGDVFFNVKLSLELQNANSCLMHLAGKIIDKHELIIHATRPAIGQIFIIHLPDHGESIIPHLPDHGESIMPPPCLWASCFSPPLFYDHICIHSPINWQLHISIMKEEILFFNFCIK